MVAVGHALFEAVANVLLVITLDVVDLNDFVSRVNDDFIILVPFVVTALNVLGAAP